MWGQECEEGDGAAASGMWGEWRRRSRGVRASPRARRGAEPALGRRGVRLGAGARVAERPAVAPRGGVGGPVGPGFVVRPDRRASGKIPYPRGLRWRRLPQSRPEKYEQLTNVSHILPILLPSVATVSGAGPDKFGLGQKRCTHPPQDTGDHCASPADATPGSSVTPEILARPRAMWLRTGFGCPHLPGGEGALY